MTVTNRYDTSDTSDVAFVAQWFDAAGAVTEQPLIVPVLGPGERATLALSPPDGAALVTVAARLAESVTWADAGPEIAFAEQLLGSPELLAPLPQHWEVEDDSLAADSIRLEGPTLGAWRAPTDNDRAVRQVELGSTSDAAGWAALHLHAPAGRTIAIEHDGENVNLTRRWGFPGRDVGVVETTRTRQVEGVLHLDTTFVPFGPWPAEATVARLGLDLELPNLSPDIRVGWFGRGFSQTYPDAGSGMRLGWFGRGFGQAYPDTGSGMRLGWFDGTVTDLQEHYLRPQDNGLRSDVRALWIEHGEQWLQISGEPFSFSLRPWSDREIDAAAHPDELGETGALVLSLNAAAHGIGTAACGPGVLPQHRLHPTPAELHLQLAVVSS